MTFSEEFKKRTIKRIKKESILNPELVKRECVQENEIKEQKRMLLNMKCFRHFDGVPAHLDDIEACGAYILKNKQ